MSGRSKIKIATAVLLVALSTGAASAAPRTPPPDSVWGRIQQIGKQIRRILLPLDEPTFPKP
jgi:hypothetical protein